MSDAYELICDTLTTHGSKSRDVRQNHAMYQCPAHEDKNPSLSVDDKGDKVMLHCHAGCHVDDVVAALGLEVKDLFDGELDKDKLHGTLIRSYLYERGTGEPWFYVDRYYPKTFRQRLPDVEPVRDLSDREAAKRLGMKGRPPILYHFPRVIRKIQEAKAKGEECWIWFLDGEKDVETAERHGLVATCPPGFHKWDERYAQVLRGATGIVMVVDQDKEKPNGELGAGQANAVVARQGFRSVSLPVRLLSPAAGKDLTDHFTAGYGEADFIADPSIYTRPRGMAASDLMVKEFAPVQWAVHGVLPAGLTICAGPPKAGKSWIALDLALAVAAGGPALSHLGTAQGSALYLAREDTYKRLQARMRLLMARGEAPPSKLEVIPSEQDWVGGEEGLANMTEWAEEARDPRIVILDTLAKIEPDMGESRNRGAYAGNYSMMSRYKQWADTHNCAVVLIHHDNKTKADKTEGWFDDPFTQISGTRGITGAADTLWFLETKRFSREGRLHITGRDVREQSLELHRVGPLWTCVTPPELDH